MIDFTKWTPEEQRIMAEIIDLAVRQAGANAVQRAFILLAKLHEANVTPLKSVTVNVPQDGTAGSGGATG